MSIEVKHMRYLAGARIEVKVTGVATACPSCGAGAEWDPLFITYSHGTDGDAPTVTLHTTHCTTIGGNR